MSKIKNFVKNGDVFSRFTVIDANCEIKSSSRHSLCRCDCGAIRLVQNSNMVKGKSKSCGCLAREIVSKEEKELVAQARRIADNLEELNETLDRFEDENEEMELLMAIPVGGKQ